MSDERHEAFLQWRQSVKGWTANGDGMQRLAFMAGWRAREQQTLTVETPTREATAGERSVGIPDWCGCDQPLRGGAHSMLCHEPTPAAPVHATAPAPVTRDDGGDWIVGAIVVLAVCIGIAALFGAYS